MKRPFGRLLLSTLLLHIYTYIFFIPFPRYFCIFFFVFFYHVFFVLFIVKCDGLPSALSSSRI